MVRLPRAARNTDAMMKPKTVFVNTPANVATRYVEYRRKLSRATSR